MSIRKRVWKAPKGVLREAHIVDYKAWNLKDVLGNVSTRHSLGRRTPKPG